MYAKLEIVLNYIGSLSRGTEVASNACQTPAGASMAVHC